MAGVARRGGAGRWPRAPHPQAFWLMLSGPVVTYGSRDTKIRGTGLHPSTPFGQRAIEGGAVQVSNLSGRAGAGMADRGAMAMRPSVARLGQRPYRPRAGLCVRLWAFRARPMLSLVPSKHAVPGSLQTSACAMLPVGGGGCGRSRLSARPLACLTRVCLPPRPCSGSKQTDAADPEAGAPACAVLEACARGQGRDHLWQGKGQARHHPQNLPSRAGAAVYGALRSHAPLPRRSRCWRGSH
jgi:hypothetical protein